MSDLPIIIIGAGISGLTLAQYLHKSHVPFRIFERDTGLFSRGGGWGLTLHWSLPALRQLLPENVQSRMPEAYVDKEATSRGDPGKFQFFDLSKGVPLFGVPAAERIRVNRGKLRNLLTTDIHVEVCMHATFFFFFFKYSRLFIDLVEYVYSGRNR